MNKKTNYQLDTYESLTQLPKELFQLTTENIMFYDTDIGGVVHNLAYLRHIEKNRTLFAEKVGFDLKKMSDDNIYPVVTNINIDYKSPATLGDKLEIYGIISEVKNVRFSFNFKIFNKKTKRLLIVSEQTLAVIKFPPGKPIKIPLDLKKYIL